MKLSDAQACLSGEPEPIERWVYPGTMQWPMTREIQQQYGLVARGTKEQPNKSIHPRNWNKAQPKTRTNGKEN